MPDYRFAYRWLNYKLFARHRQGHGVHSPFVYRLIREVLMDNRTNDHFSKVESIRKQLLHNRMQVYLTDYGAGSRKGKREICRIGDLVRAVSVRPKYGRLLYNLSVWMDTDATIELGTSAGISSLYLAGAVPGKPFYSIEGDEALAAIARGNLELAGLKNATIIRSSFDHGLEEIIPKMSGNLLIFMDGDHRKESTLRYFRLLLDKITPGSMVIIDDIHWSAEMEQAWQIICQCAEVKVSIDLFYMGILLFKQELQKENYRIKF